MGFWKAVAKSFLDDQEYKRATAQQDAYNAVNQGPTWGQAWQNRRANRRADQDADVWWRFHRSVDDVIEEHNQTVKNRRDDIRNIIGGCWCGDPNCPNR
jgi:hypothetical protein